MTFEKHLEALKKEHNESLHLIAHLSEQVTELKSELATDNEIQRLNKIIETLHEELQHYSMPKWIWNNMEEHRKELGISCWDKIEIEELPFATAYTCIYKDKYFREFN